MNVEGTSSTIIEAKFQSPSNRVKCSDVWAPKYADIATFRAAKSFNPLVIGSSVLIPGCQYIRRMSPRAYEFQSPSNRVKCSD